MIGGLAVRGNLLCVTWSAARGHVFLYDLEAKQRVSSWTTPVGPAGFSDAAGVALDEHFRLFVADPHNDCVRRFNAFGQHLGDLGEPPPGAGDRGRDRVGVLDRPHGVAVFGDRLYVALGDRPRQRGVQCFATDGRVLRPLAAQGDAHLRFGAPRGICADARGVVVADTLRGALQVFRPDGSFVREHVGCGRPVAVARAADGAIWYVDRDAEPGVRCLGVDGVRRAVGELGGRCREPLAVALDALDRVHLLDLDGERVLRADARGDAVEVLVDLVEHDLDAPNHSP
ncbi:MAG: NHL repeat-containing protein [Planctomycetes bacterium]|nr:NHL repeat-containing protein [Planctomycetota bacterium]